MESLAAKGEKLETVFKNFKASKCRCIEEAERDSRTINRALKCSFFLSETKEGRLRGKTDEKKKKEGLFSQNSLRLVLGGQYKGVYRSRREGRSLRSKRRREKGEQQFD